ncbi:MAG TPA: SIS domain-containing protein [Gemmatimonadales bacterium]|jgi:D-sedoheptulose 7-phosphate isomerase|nr:SIS domain-containing protein [Gemmatimonadales bacterium]
MSTAQVEGALSRLAGLAEASKALAPQLLRVADRYTAALRSGGTLYFCGNGGSAADAQHLATEYVVRYAANRRALAAVALTTDSSILTAAGNDLGFDQIFARQVEAYCGPGDVLVLHSTSGRSSNLLAAASAARGRRAGTVAFLGRGGGPLAGLVDEAVVVPSDDTGLIQILHLALQHVVVELVEAALGVPSTPR